MFKTIISISAIVALTGCNFPSWESEVLEYRTIKAKVIHKRNPKHFKLTVRDIETGQEWRHSSKHCNVHRKYVVGETITMTTAKFKDTYIDTSGKIKVSEYWRLYAVC